MRLARPAQSPSATPASRSHVRAALAKAGIDRVVPGPRRRNIVAALRRRVARSLYDDARRRFAEKKFARDTQRARLEWLRAKAFGAATGGVSERRSVVDASEDLARKGQELRELTR